MKHHHPRVLLFLCGFVTIITVAVAYAQEVVEATAQIDAGAAFMTIVEGVQNKNWLLVTCAALMISIWVWNIFIMPRLISSEKHPKWRKASPWISIGIATVAQFASAIIAGNSFPDAMNTAVMMGFTASGMWSGGGKKMLGVVEKKMNGLVKN